MAVSMEFVNEGTPITRVNKIEGKILNIPFIEKQENTLSRFAIHRRPLPSTSAQNLIRRR